MFRRSFKVFLALAFCTLAAILGFALLRFRGPEEALTEAAAHFERGDYARTIRLLDLSEGSASLQRDPSKLQRLWRLRYAANARLDNPTGALRDLARLLAQPGTDEPALRLDYIRLLAVAGDGEAALREARQFLAKDPQNGRALELAGEAGQTSYRDELASLSSTIDRDLGPGRRAAGRQELLAYLYRPDGDPEVAQGLENLRTSYSTQARLAAAWPALAQRLQGLRARVQESLGYFQHSLETDGEPVAAMRGLALSLDQSQRIDDLLALCESYRLRFDHRYVEEAGAFAAWSLVRRGQYHAALATAQRWLPSASLKARAEAGRFGPAVGDLLLARYTAALRLQDQKAMERIGPDLRTLTDAGMKLPLVSGLLWGTLQLRRKDWQNAENNLRGANYQLLRNPVPIGQQDLLPELVEMRLEAMAGRGAATSEQLALFAEWAKARPGEVQPLIAAARFQLADGKPAAAMAALDDAAQIDPDDEQIFEVRLAAAEELYRDSRQDGLGLLEQCLRRPSLVPDVPHPLGYVLCAQAALAQGQAAIARESAAAAIDKFPSARRPRLLRAEAELLANRPAEAAELLLQLLDDLPDDGEIAALCLKAHRLAGLVPGGVLAAAMKSNLPSPELTAEVLRSALADGRTDAAMFVPGTLPTGPAGTELRILAAHALARAGRGSEAEAMLQPLAGRAAELTPVQRRELAEAVVTGLVTAARNTADRPLLAIATRQLAAFTTTDAAAAAALLRGGAELESSHPASAYTLVTAGLAIADPEQRAGSSHALAGRLAAHLALHHLAADHWTAAIAFPDGRAAAEPLARLCLADGRPERAIQAFRLVEAPTDGGLAARLGDVALAERLARAALQRDGADLLAHAVLAGLGHSSSCDDLKALPEALRPVLFTLGSQLDVEELAAFALPLAKSLADAMPDSPSAQLLFARALRQSGAVEPAAALHRQLLKQNKSPLLWREVALAAATPGYRLDDAFVGEIAYAAAKNQIEGSPVVHAFSLQRTAAVIVKSGNQGIADPMLADMWLQYPEFTEPTLADAKGLAARGHRLRAWLLLDRMLPTLPAEQRGEALEAMFTIGAALWRERAPGAEMVTAAASRLLASEGAHGCLVHFLLDGPGRYPTNPIAESAAKKMLTDHVERAGRGGEPEIWLQRSIQRLIADHGLDAATLAVDAALAAHPTSLPLWRHRTVLLGQRQRGPEAVAEFRAVLRHAKAPTEQLEYLVLAGTHLAVSSDDLQLLPQLPLPTLMSPDGQLAVGLVSLRLGRPDESIVPLERATVRPDGLPLQALTLAQLQSVAGGGLARAAATCQKLATDYPSSSLARYAGSFARQFAGR
jgi:predicted Zn-dependent protease